MDTCIQVAVKTQVKAQNPNKNGKNQWKNTRGKDPMSNVCQMDCWLRFKSGWFSELRFFFLFVWVCVGLAKDDPSSAVQGMVSFFVEVLKFDLSEQQYDDYWCTIDVGAGGQRV